MDRRTEVLEALGGFGTLPSPFLDLFLVTIVNGFGSVIAGVRVKRAGGPEKAGRKAMGTSASKAPPALDAL